MALKCLETRLKKDKKLYSNYSISKTTYEFFVEKHKKNI